MKKIIFLLIIPLFSLYPADREIEVGRKFWPLAGSSNIELVSDKTAGSFLSIKENEYEPDRKTILLMHFNGITEYDDTGRSKIENLSISGKIKKLGSGSGVFNASGSPVIFKTAGKSFFPEKIYSGDFTVEFWLNSRNTSDGETYFLYENYTDTGEKVLPQLFRCFLEDRNVTWEIKNLFLPVDKKPFSLTLKGNSRIIPGKWSHHLLRFSSETGFLEYLFNGIPEASAYVNKKNAEDGTVYSFYAGTSSRIVMGDNFTGALDEFRLQGEWTENPRLSRIGNLRGEFITEKIDLKHSKSRIFSIDFNDTVPPGTDLKYYYHISDTPASPGLESGNWTEIKNSGAGIQGGRFLYLKGVLFSDGEKTVSPSVNMIKIKYNEKSAPPPPSVVKAEVSDKKIKLRWSTVPDSDIDGYLVYIGDKPGHYFGAGNGSGSPVDAGLNNSLVIDNLENGRVYYFSVCSYYKTASPVGSIISKGGNYSAEVSARPAADLR